MNRPRQLIVAALLTLATGCGAPTGAPEPAAPAPPAVASAPTSPVELDFDAVGVLDTPLTPTGLDETGSIAVPPVTAPEETNYLAWAPQIAAGRPLVLTAHVSGCAPDGAAVPGAFFRLAEAERGDTVAVTGADGARTTYTVTSASLVDKDAFPAEVYRPRPEPTLVLITCGGVLDRAAGNYLSNVIVEAVAAR